MSDAGWLDPEPARPQGDPLEAEHVRGWRERGFALVDGVFPDTLLAQARKDLDETFPPAGSEAAETVTDFGSDGIGARYGPLGMNMAPYARALADART